MPQTLKRKVKVKPQTRFKGKVKDVFQGPAAAHEHDFDLDLDALRFHGQKGQAGTRTRSTS